MKYGNFIFSGTDQLTSPENKQTIRFAFVQQSVRFAFCHRLCQDMNMQIFKQVHGWASVTQSFLSNLGSWVRYARQFGLVARRLLGLTLATKSRPLTALTKPAEKLPNLPPMDRFA